MLSILYNEYKEWGCPNCGCDSAISGCFSGGGVTTGTCRHCKLTFEIRSDNGIGTVRYGSHPENPSDPKSEYVMEYARRIPHPRSGTLGTVKVGVRIPQSRHLFPCSLVG